MIDRSGLKKCRTVLEKLFFKDVGLAGDATESMFVRKIKVCNCSSGSRSLKNNKN